MDFSEKVYFRINFEINVLLGLFGYDEQQKTISIIETLTIKSLYAIIMYNLNFKASGGHRFGYRLG